MEGNENNMRKKGLKRTKEIRNSCLEEEPRGKMKLTGLKAVCRSCILMSADHCVWQSQFYWVFFSFLQSLLFIQLATLVACEE